MIGMGGKQPKNGLRGKLLLKGMKQKVGEGPVMSVSGETDLASTNPLTMTFLKGGLPNRAVDSTSRV